MTNICLFSHILLLFHSPALNIKCKIWETWKILVISKINLTKRGECTSIGLFTGLVSNELKAWLFLSEMYSSNHRLFRWVRSRWNYENVANGNKIFFPNFPMSFNYLKFLSWYYKFCHSRKIDCGKQFKIVRD